MIRLHRIDHVCLRVADLDEAAARWALQFGLIERSRESGRALLACNDEPYCLELVEAGEPGPRPCRLRARPATARSTTRRRTSSRRPCRGRSARAASSSPTPTGAESSSCRTARRRPRSTAGRQHARPSTSVHLGGPRKLGHVNCLTGAIQELHASSTGTCSACASATGSTTAACGSTSTRTTTSWRSWTGATPTSTTSPSRRWTSGRCATCSTTSPATGAGSAGARRVTASRATSRATCASSRKPASSSCTATWSSSRKTTCPACIPDDRYSSNTWGPLPPRSYFRFDAEAIEYERQSLETLGHQLPPAKVKV